jgi:MFS family permease
MPSDTENKYYKSAEIPSERWNYYGWIITMAMLLLVFVVWGSYYAFGVFLKPLAEEFGWSRAVTSGPYGLSLIIQGISGLAVGAVCDRYGPRGITTIACLMTAAGYILLSRMDSLWEFYTSMLVLVAIGTSAAYVVPVATLPRWFAKNRGLALGLALAGMGIGDMVFPRTMTYFIWSYDWRDAYMVMAGVVVAAALICGSLLRPSPQLPQPILQKKTGAEKQPRLFQQVRKLPRFWGLLIIWMLGAVPLQMVRGHIVSDATDAGMSQESAAFLLTFMGATMTVFRIGTGRISDWMGNKSTYLVCLSLQILALIALARGGGSLLYFGSVVIFAMGAAGASITYPKIVADMFGVASMGTIIGLLAIGWNIGAGVGPPLAGWIFDRMKSYSWAYIAGSAAMAAAMVLAVIVLRGYVQHSGKWPSE